MATKQDSGPQAGVLHPVDQAFYDLTVKERNVAWAEREELIRLVQREHGAKAALGGSPCICKWCQVP